MIFSRYNIINNIKNLDSCSHMLCDYENMINIRNRESKSQLI